MKREGEGTVWYIKGSKVALVVVETSWPSKLNDFTQTSFLSTQAKHIFEILSSFDDELSGKLASVTLNC